VRFRCRLRVLPGFGPTTLTCWERKHGKDSSKGERYLNPVLDRVVLQRRVKSHLNRPRNDKCSQHEHRVKRHDWQFGHVV